MERHSLTVVYGKTMRLWLDQIRQILESMKVPLKDQALNRQPGLMMDYWMYPELILVESLAERAVTPFQLGLNPPILQEISSYLDKASKASTMASGTMVFFIKLIGEPIQMVGLI